jgi:pyruvate/2-oxoglutarate dehydrogenase complex dihydrolipoamide acyltransferase (E2) component
MAFVFQLPEIGEGVVEGEIVAWKVQVGASVTRDAPFCEVMTDKATVEISSPTSGVVTKLYGQPGDIVKVHAPLAEIDESGSASAGPAAPAQAASPQAASPQAPAAAQPPAGAPKAPPSPQAAPPSSSVPAPSSAAAAAPSGPRGPAKAAPAVRRDARERGIDIHEVAGTGPGGRVTRSDLENYGGGPAPALPAAVPQVAMPVVRPSGTRETIKIIGLRRKIAQQMLAAKQSAPHFTYVEEIDVTDLVALRARLKKRAEKDRIKLTYLPFILKACSVAFREFPNVNATMNNDAYELTVHGDHNVGVATDTPAGLYVPVIKNIEQKSILHIAADMQTVTDRVRAGKATLDDLTGGTFTVTSVGNLGGVLATPILNVPEVAILGVNAIRERPVVRDGQIVIRSMMHLSPSFDHRIIDGAVAARFVARVKDLLEDPGALLVELA